MEEMPPPAKPEMSPRELFDALPENEPVRRAVIAAGIAEPSDEFCATYLLEFVAIRDAFVAGNEEAVVEALLVVIAEKVRAELALERLQVQLAGCGAAAMGAIEPRAREAKQGDYGWSPSYGDVVALRRNYEELDAKYDDLVQNPDSQP